MAIVTVMAMGACMMAMLALALALAGGGKRGSDRDRPNSKRRRMNRIERFARRPTERRKELKERRT